jgi:hypothetical protein
MAGGMSNKIGNVMGVPLPYPVRTQLQMRSTKNNPVSLGGLPGTYDWNRDMDNVKYRANKSSWVRLVSSVDISGDDFETYRKMMPPGIQLKTPSDLAKNFILSAGTSIYEGSPTTGAKYKSRSGLSTDGFGAYGILGEEEIKQFGYRPMPGITDAKIATQGRLGSVRQAEINFKVWNKDQLDIIDALYFKMGYLMFLEWGHTFYYDNGGNLKQNEFDLIDPFTFNLDKEGLNIAIANNIEKTNGNYDAMLGMCTQFNFDFNQEGGFDCSIKMIGLGALADATKINQGSKIPAIQEAEIKSYLTLFHKLKEADLRKKALEEQAKNPPATPPAPPVHLTIDETLAKNVPSISKNLIDWTVPTSLDKLDSLATRGTITLPSTYGDNSGL